MRKYYFLLFIVSITVSVLYFGETHADRSEQTGYVVESVETKEIEEAVQLLLTQDASSKTEFKTLEYDEPQNNHIVNGISLYSDKTTVLKELGEPIEINEHEFLIDYEEYHYDHMTISFSGEWIQDIAIPASEKQFQIGSRILSTDPNLIEELFGPPELRSEDGILYSKDDIYIKVFHKPGTTNMDSIHFFIEGL